MSSFDVLPASAKELAESFPAEEFNRLLFLPRSKQLEDDLLDRATGAREWYATHGHPFVAYTRVNISNVETPEIVLANDVRLRSVQLAERLQKGDAHALVVLAASAGTEVADQVALHWKEGRPDEAFFLDRFAVGITEQLVRWSSAFLCREAEPAQETLLPHLSPGCGHWDLADQHRLMSMLTTGTQLGPLELLESGGLHPQHSVMAALGVTHHKFSITPRDICSGCDYNPCAFRRAPYKVLHNA